MTKRVLSLFSGCGGMDLGFEGNFWTHRDYINEFLYPEWITEKREFWLKLSPTNFVTIFANDISKSAMKAWTKYFSLRGKKADVFYLESIVDLVQKFYDNQFDFPDSIDVVTGGFPCQDFSVAGKRKGFQSHKSHTGDFLSKYDQDNSTNRGQLYIWMKEVINITKPKIFIAENVKGLVSLSNAKAVIERDFSQVGEKGYLVLAKVLFAPDYGIPQTRQRIFFIGLNKQWLKPEAMNCLINQKEIQKYNPFPLKTHTENLEQIKFFNNLQYLKKYTKVKSALEGLLEPDLTINDLSQVKYSKAKYCPQHQGQIEIKLDGLAPTIRAEHHGNIEYRRLSVEHKGRYINELNQGLPERRLTVRECARIQTFPDDYEFVLLDKNKPHKYFVSASDAYKLIGNAVPPFLAFHIAKRLENIWDNLFIA